MKVRNGMTRKFMVPVLGVLLAALPAWAQQDDGGQEERVTTLEEVIVTAQKREESLQDTPISAVTFSDEDLQALGANELAVAVNYAPNVIVRKQPNSNANYALGMRGVNSGDPALTVDPVVGMYVDGIYLGRMSGAALDIGDMERMEVLRGPQGSLYGRNVIGGAINMVSRKPGDQFEFSQYVGLGERGYKRSQTIFNSPMFGRGTSLRVNYIRDERDGIVQNRGYANTDAIDNILEEEILFNNDDLGEQLSEAWRFALRLNPAPGMRVNYAYEKNDRYAKPTIAQIKNVNIRGNTYLGLLGPAAADGRVVPTNSLYTAAQVTARDADASTDLDGDPMTITPAEQLAAQQRLLGAGTHFITQLGPYVGANLFPGTQLYAPTDAAPASIYPIFDQAAQIAELDDRLGYLPLYYGGEETSDTDGHLLSIEWDVLENAVFKVLSSYRSWDSGIFSLVGDDTGTDFGTFQVAPSDSSRLLNIELQQGEETFFLQPDIAVMDGTSQVRAGEWVSLFRAGRTSDQQQFTQEIQLLGESYDGRFRYVMGLYYFEEQANESNPQYTSFPGAALPLIGGVSSAFDRSTIEFGIRIQALIPALTGAYQAATSTEPTTIDQATTGRILGLLDAGLDVATVIQTLGATSEAATALNILNQAGSLDTALAAGQQAATAGAARVNLFQDMGSGSLCGDPNGAQYGTTDLTPAINTRRAGFGQPALPAGSLSIANACLDKTILGGSPVFVYGTDNEAVAAYVQGALDLSERVNLAVGLRYTIDKRSAYLRYSQIDVDGDDLFGEVEDTVRASEEWDKGTYDITFNYHWLDDFSTFAKVATGYRAGGFSARAPSAATFQTPVNAEELISYELGWKFEGLGRTLRVNGALFKMDYGENQTTQFSPTLAGATLITHNEGDRQLEGAELEITWVPLAGLTWNLNLGYLDAYWDYYPLDGTELDAFTGLRSPHDPNAVVPYSPEISYSTILEYQLPTLFNVDIGNWVARLEVQYQDEFSISPAVSLDDPGAAPDRTIVNLRLTLSDVRLSDGGRMSFSLWGKNITDEEYQEFPIPFLAFNIATFGEPSSAGIDFRYEY